MSGRCLACNKAFNSFEPKFNEKKKDYEDLCNNCLRTSMNVAYNDETVDDVKEEAQEIIRTIRDSF